jgi:hypothetical protein
MTAPMNLNELSVLFFSGVTKITSRLSEANFPRKPSLWILLSKEKAAVSLVWTVGDFVHPGWVTRLAIAKETTMTTPFHRTIGFLLFKFTVHHLYANCSWKSMHSKGRAQPIRKYSFSFPLAAPGLVAIEYSSHLP